MQTTDEVKGYYAELVNHTLGYAKVTNRISWPCSTINCSREKLAIVLVKGKEPTEELKKEIQNYVKAHTAPYKYPRIVVFKDELPKTVSGKIMRNKL